MLMIRKLNTKYGWKMSSRNTELSLKGNNYRKKITEIWLQCVKQKQSYHLKKQFFPQNIMNLDGI